MEENSNVKTDNMKTIKVIGTIMWVVTAFMLGMALFVDYIQGFKGNADAFHIIVWMFGIVFITMTPIYLHMIYSNTMYLTEGEIKRNMALLYEKIDFHNSEAIIYSKASKKCFTDLQEMKDALGYKSKEDKVKEVDDLFNDMPLDENVQALRRRVLTYIRENG